MAACVYLHDGSFEGLLTAVAVAVKSPRPVQNILSEESYTAQLFDTVELVASDAGQAGKLFAYLEHLRGCGVMFTINGYLGEEKAAGFHLYRMVRLCLQHGARALELYSDDSIRYLSQLSRRVNGEAHRLYGLIRFRELKENIYYAPFESDCNVIGYLARHFASRMGSRQWILHDVGRNIGLHWDGSKVQSIEVDTGFTAHVREHGEVSGDHFSHAEQYYQQLWQSFHATIANPDRENRRLQRQLMPKRYWQYLVEMREGSPAAPEDGALQKKWGA